ncbi:MAG: VCBS repeat-containing protein [Acidobacteriaceae bacterium]|nr:VCBS repeat-containing protein [Acidobacteriaceae bacterium]
MSLLKDLDHFRSRRTFLQGLALAPLVFRPAPLPGLVFRPGIGEPRVPPELSSADFRLRPVYPAKSPLEDVLRRVRAGMDEFLTEKYAFEIGEILRQWSAAIKEGNASTLGRSLDAEIEGVALDSSNLTTLRNGFGIDVVRRNFPAKAVSGREHFSKQVESWLRQLPRVETAEFEITGIEELATAPVTLRLDIRYDLVGTRNDEQREERVGVWRTEWQQDETGGWKALQWESTAENLATARERVFIDVTAQALGVTDSYKKQLLRGADYWRTVLDGACGIDVYGNNGVTAGDFDNDGFDDLYVCQPAGLPNRLYRNRRDGTFEDVTDKAGVGVLDSTACALFADFRNGGLQDLLVVCGSGPLLFLNQGNGTFSLKRDAFRFAQTPQGTFTHAAVADYDRDGRLDIYFCLYSYYLGLDQYHYPVPYYDARNGPANFLLHNEGNGAFVDRTEAAGLNADNNRYSFACAWGDASGKGLPDLYVANDFGRSNLYRNNGDGTFTVSSGQAHVEDAGAGMSASWADIDNSGKHDIYAANMWSAAGQRVSAQEIFQKKAPEDVRALYRRHARGNSLYRNRGDGKFENVGESAGADMGRWAWCSDFWDFDHDGYPDLYIANGYISGPERSDVASFFWRQVVARSPNDATASPAYEHGWNALNELIRSDATWNGYERNVMFANNRDGTFSEVSGVVGLDFAEDGRSFALADIDHDGRLEMILKNRNAPQLRILRNAMTEVGDSIAFRLRGRTSNRDGIGASITVEAGALRQTKYLQAGSGFLAQHTKEVFFGLGKASGQIRANIRWPSGLTQEFSGLPVNHRINLEEGSAEFAAKAFSAPPAVYGKAGSEPAIEPLPSRVETWLIEPLNAPEFSLPDLTGRVHSLDSSKGSYVLLCFWAEAAEQSGNQLSALHQHRAALSGKLNVCAINADGPDALQRAQSFAVERGFWFPVLFANQETVGKYNIVYRYLFDRRRDLAIPTSFLIDKRGMIVKVYQGVVNPEQVLRDVNSIPQTAEDRVQRALPAAGVLYQGAFQRNDYNYGIAMFQHGYLDQAAASFQQAIAEDPEDAEAYYNLGTLNLRRSNLADAQRYLEQTVKLRPNYSDAWNNLGMIAGQQGHDEAAVQNFKQALLLKPDSAIALLNLGNLYRRMGNYDQAKSLLTRAMEIEPDDPEVNYSLGMLYALQNQTDKAAEYLERAVDLQPDYPQALNNLGILFARERNYPKAEAQFKACIRVAPSFDQSYLNLARVYVSESDRAKAREVLQDLLHLQPEHPAARRALEMLQ